MNDPVDRVLLEKILDPGTVCHVELDELEFLERPELLEAAPFESRVVVRAQVIEADNTIAPSQKRTGNMEPDEARGTGHERVSSFSHRSER